jgi:hypothetical protein
VVLGCLLMTLVSATAQPVTVDSIGDVGWQTSIAIDQSGYPRIGYIAGSPGNDLKYARKTAAGWSVETASDICNPNSATNLILDFFDNPAMATGINEGLYVFNKGSGWVVEEIGGFATWYVSMALDHNDVPHILYNWSVYKEFTSRVAYATRLGPDNWVETTVLGGPFVPSYPVYSLALDGNDNRHIAYITFNSDTLRYSFSSGSISVNEKFRPASYCDIALDLQNKPHIVYYDYELADLVLIEEDGWIFTPETVDHVGNVGDYCSIAMGIDGSYHIVYYDTDNGDLKYAGRAGPAAPWNIQVVDSLGDVGMWPSVAVDNAGRPHIAYYDATNGDLKYTYLSPLVPVKKTTWGSLKALMKDR